jgi:hypothetical protein
MNRPAAAILAGALLAGCASSLDWRFSEVSSTVESYRLSQPAAGADLPHRIRSIRIDGADSLTVYLSDDPGLRGHGWEVRLRRSPSGSWVVSGSRLFDY